MSQLGGRETTDVTSIIKATVRVDKNGLKLPPLYDLHKLPRPRGRRIGCFYVVTLKELSLNKTSDWN